MRPPFFYVKEFADSFGAMFSRSINAMFFKGSIHQSLSARSHIDGRAWPTWRAREKFIDRLFFWEKNHCANAYGEEVYRARRTLELNGARGGYTEARPAQRINCDMHQVDL